VILFKYYQNDEIKEKDTDWACGMQDREKKTILKHLMRNFEMKPQFGK
jgi:hypothetical protein